MLEMIKKHTIPDTGNWRIICPMVDRSHEMLRMAKDATRSFVPPSHQREQVPLGSSSVSMYPGYSPADHKHGKAAQDYGLAVAAARREGIDLKPGEHGLDYSTGQARGAKRDTSASMKAAKAAKEGPSGSGTPSNSDAYFARATLGGQAADMRSEDEAGNGDHPYFVIDTNPTPVNLPGMSHKPAKGPTEDPSPPEPVGQKKIKKLKTKHDGELPASMAAFNIETEDISEEVDARLKEREERRRRKEEKKRKRLSDGSTGPVTEPTTTDAVAEKPKKKKAKKVEGSEEANRAATKKRHSSDNEAEGGVDGEGSTKKRKKTKARSETN
ncbi:MAG: hypothetical protein LQ347_006571 [Umbilicaria vellea]|nr:MAG: hypothetical protein LQ347_006571 [Umbilicaria vellea]